MTKHCLCIYCESCAGIFSDSKTNEKDILRHLRENHPNQPKEYKVVVICCSLDFPSFYEKYVIPRNKNKEIKEEYIDR